MHLGPSSAPVAVPGSVWIGYAPGANGTWAYYCCGDASVNGQPCGESGAWVFAGSTVELGARRFRADLGGLDEADGDLALLAALADEVEANPCNPLHFNIIVGG